MPTTNSVPWIVRSLSNVIVVGAVVFGLFGVVLFYFSFPTRPISYGVIMLGGVLGALSGVIWSALMWKLLLERRVMEDKRKVSKREP